MEGLASGFDNYEVAVKPNLVLFIILDGWGIGPDSPYNAIKLANPAAMNRLVVEYPSTELEASGKHVGLLEGLMGNSEVGHLNLGAGRVVPQDIVRISNSIQDGTFFNNKEFLDLFSFAKSHGGKVHLLGLLSEGGVHSSFDHLLALIELSVRSGCRSLFAHPFLDGRDSPPQSALPLLEKLEQALQRAGGKIATICGRYYAMDRDKRWDRLEKAYRALVLAEGEKAATASEGVERGTARGETDEFLLPTVIHNHGTPVAKIEDGDGIIFFNFRADRARQLTSALTCSDFTGFKLPRPDVRLCTMTEYDASFTVPVAFKKENLTHTLPEVWSEAGLTQFHTAETEKYAHVTYFFSGGRETPFPGEDRLLIPSPKVATYDLAPQMSAPALTEACFFRILEKRHHCIVMNFANADMVGHTGNLQAAIKAIHVVDGCVERLVNAALQNQGIVIITADHGNAEMMADPATGTPHTAHTTSRVPLILVHPGMRGWKLRGEGKLADVAPTILEIQEMTVPIEMTGESLLKKGSSFFFKNSDQASRA